MEDGEGLMNPPLKKVWITASDAESTGHGGHVPQLLQVAGHVGTVSRRTANKKLYWPSRKRSPKRLIVLLELKMEGHDRQKKSRLFGPEQWERWRDWFAGYLYIFDFCGTSFPDPLPRGFVPGHHYGIYWLGPI